RRSDGPAHGNARQAERQIRTDDVEQLFLVCAARRTVTEDAHLVPGIAMFLDQIAHMPEDAPDGRAETVEDAQFIGSCHAIRRAVRERRSCLRRAVGWRSTCDRSAPAR